MKHRKQVPLKSEDVEREHRHEKVRESAEQAEDGQDVIIYEAPTPPSRVNAKHGSSNKRNNGGRPCQAQRPADTDTHHLSYRDGELRDGEAEVALRQILEISRKLLQNRPFDETEGRSQRVERVRIQAPLK